MEQKLQYNPTKSYSTCKEFTNSFDKIEKEFVLEELKQLVPPREVRTPDPRLRKPVL